MYSASSGCAPVARGGARRTRPGARGVGPLRPHRIRRCKLRAERPRSIDEARVQANHLNRRIDVDDDAKEVVADWKAKLDTAMLRARADRSERYAEAALVVALSGVDQAEKAMLSAGLARNEAESAKAK